MVKGAPASRVVVLGIVVAMVAGGFALDRAGAAASIEPTGAVDEVAFRLDGSRARGIAADGPAGSLTSGDIHVTDADLDTEARLREFADDEEFILVMPEGKNLVWRFWPGRQVDDLGFLDLVLDEVQADYAVDSSRIYMMGHSNGGMLTHQYACDRPGRVAAFGSVGGPLVDPSTCAEPGGETAPFLIMQGTRDPLVPRDGWLGAMGTPTAVTDRRCGCTTTTVRPVPT